MLLTLETSKWIVSRPTCLRFERRSNICPFDSNHFNLHFNRVFVFVLKCFRSLQHVSRVCRRYCVQIFEIIYVLLQTAEIRSGCICERRVYVETGLIAIREISPLFGAPSSHRNSFQNVPVR